MYSVYILYSKNLNQTYVGFTSNLERRLKEHKQSPTKTTRRSNDYILVWYAKFIERSFAEKFEKYLKSHSGRIFMRKRLIGDLIVTGSINENK